MAEKCSCGKKYMLTFTLGAIGGGILLAWATKAMPKIMSGMMRNMMSHMSGQGCSPSDI